jgi:hypothetical protein
MESTTNYDRQIRSLELNKKYKLVIEAYDARDRTMAGYLQNIHDMFAKDNPESNKKALEHLGRAIEHFKHHLK